MSMELLRKYLWLWAILGSISVSLVIAIVFVCINRWLSRQGRHRITQLHRNKSDLTIKSNKYQVETPPLPSRAQFLTAAAQSYENLADEHDYEEAKPVCQVATPKHQESTPVCQVATPKHQESTPVYQVATPKHQESTPVYQVTTSKYQESMPKYQEAMSDYEEAMSDYEEASAGYEEASPDYENPTPEPFDYVNMEAEVRILPPLYRKTDEETDDASTEDYDDIDGEDDGEEDYDDVG
ncbi:DNA-directed RNA polymerase II subunit RPB1 [Pseudochaenichthys georgianus]|uniref:DNA-directed RNA polymerase II subunit RPB1 n=1 Tax=Pseudochaenichthys georgianus TaxID=52239 RepID=UPI00146C746D|nr:zinc finger protein 768-like [Pseudochaenichthys georgianus]XP_033954280.1 zinc finger protein 768-like [Pseudochaenichthys georgianus]